MVAEKFQPVTAKKMGPRLDELAQSREEARQIWEARLAAVAEGEEDLSPRNVQQVSEGPEAADGRKIKEPKDNHCL